MPMCAATFGGRGGNLESLRSPCAPIRLRTTKTHVVAQIVYIDTCELRWCSIDSAAFHSFVWPRNIKEAKGIARTLFTNHCNWVDVLILRCRCFSSNGLCFRANRALEHLPWNWSKMRRPYVVYQDGNEATSDCDLLPAWLAHECVYKGFCQCQLVGLSPHGWHHPGALYSNIVSRRRQLFEKTLWLLPGWMADSYWLY